jgi:acetyl esterase/lipase
MAPSKSQNEEIFLWPDGAPGSQDWTQVEEETILPPSLPVVRNVTRPRLTVYPADPAKARGTGLIICPGGAWHFLAIAHEGTAVARWLAEHGITAFILRYRLIRTEERFAEEIQANMADRAKMFRLLEPILPLTSADGQQAVRLVRQRAAEWGIQPNRVGMMGFSAGGYLTASVALDNPPESRPDFAAPIYPAVFEAVTAPADAPPLFLLCANDDDMATTGCQHLYTAWKAVGRPVELHIYAQGGHGFGMNQLGLPSDTWIERFFDWLQAQGF